MEDGRRPRKVDAQVVHQAANTPHLFDIGFGIKAAAARAGGLDQAPLLVSAQRGGAHAGARRHDRDGVPRLVAGAVLGTVMDWLAHGCPGTPARMAASTAPLLIATVTTFER